MGGVSQFLFFLTQICRIELYAEPFCFVSSMIYVYVVAVRASENMVDIFGHMYIFYVHCKAPCVTKVIPSHRMLRHCVYQHLIIET